MKGFIQGEQKANAANLREIAATKPVLAGVTGSRDPKTGVFSGGLLSSLMDFFGSDNSGSTAGDNLEYIDNMTQAERDAYYGYNLGQDAGSASGMLYDDYSNYA